APRYGIAAIIANYGGGPAADASLEVDLDALVLAGFLIDTDTVTSDNGILHYRDAANGAWVPAPRPPGLEPTAVRLDFSSLAPDEAALLHFEMVAPLNAEPGVVPIVATGSTAAEPEPVRSVGYLDVAPAHAHALEALGPG